MAEENGGRTDAAALGGGVVAIAMAMFAEPGPYDLIGVAVAITLGLLIAGYIATTARGRWQSVAIGGVAAIVLLPIWGYFADIYEWPIWTDAHQQAIRDAWLEAHRATAPPHNPLLERIGEPSTVSERAALLFWLLATLAVAALDRLWQRRLKAGREQDG